MTRPGLRATVTICLVVAVIGAGFVIFANRDRPRRRVTPSKPATRLLPQPTLPPRRAERLPLLRTAAAVALGIVAGTLGGLAVWAGTGWLLRQAPVQETGTVVNPAAYDRIDETTDCDELLALVHLNAMHAALDAADDRHTDAQVSAKLQARAEQRHHDRGCQPPL